MKAKYINNRPAQLSQPNTIEVGDVIEQNNPPRGVNYWKVLEKRQEGDKEGDRLFYTVEMLQGSAFVGSIYVKEYQYRTLGKIVPMTGWWYVSTKAKNN